MLLLSMAVSRFFVICNLSMLCGNLSMLERVVVDVHVVVNCVQRYGNSYKIGTR